MNNFDDMIAILPMPSQGAGEHKKPILLSLTRSEVETIRTALTKAAEIERGDKVVVLMDAIPVTESELKKTLKSVGRKMPGDHIGTLDSKRLYQASSVLHKAMLAASGVSDE